MYIRGEIMKGLFQRHVCTIQNIGSTPSPPPGGDPHCPAFMSESTSLPQQLPVCNIDPPNDPITLDSHNKICFLFVLDFFF